MTKPLDGTSLEAVEGSGTPSRWTARGVAMAIGRRLGLGMIHMAVNGLLGLGLAIISPVPWGGLLLLLWFGMFLVVAIAPWRRAVGAVLGFLLLVVVGLAV